MKELSRYTFNHEMYVWKEGISMHPCPNGTWYKRDDVEQALAEKDKQIAAALEKVSYWQQCHSQTAEAMRVSSEANTRLQKQLAEAKEVFDDLQKHYHAANKQIEQLRQQNADQANEIEQLESTANMIAKDRDIWMESAELHERHAKRLQGQLEQFRQENQSLKARITELEGLFASVAIYLRQRLADSDEFWVVTDIADALSSGRLMWICPECSAPNSVHNDGCWNCCAENPTQPEQEKETPQ
jgi:myosin heavy subunit